MYPFSEPLIVIILLVACSVCMFFFIKKFAQIKEDAVHDFKESEAKGEVVTIPEEFNNVALGVGSGIKFGFGFTLGAFLAGILISIISMIFFGISLTTLIS